MRPTQLDLVVTRGDDERFVFQFLDVDGAPFDLSPYSFVANILDAPKQGAEVVASFTISEGIVPFERVLALTDEQTRNLPDRGYWYLTVFRALDNYTQTWLSGRLSAAYSGVSIDDETGDDNLYEVRLTNGDIQVITAGNIGPPGAPGIPGAQGPVGPVGGANATDMLLKSWTESGAFEMTAITYDGTTTTVPVTATVKWPDDSAGTFTATTINATFAVVDAYTITHTASGSTVTQSAVTRNAEGNVTVKPALTVS